MRYFGVQYRCIFLLVLCILTRPAGSSKYCRTRKNIYMLFTGWEVRTGKIFCRGLKNVFETETKYFSVRTDLNGK